MTVNMKLYAREQTKGLRSGAYELEGGAEVETLITAAQREAGLSLPEEDRKILAFLVNGKPAQWSTGLKDGDEVKVLRKIIGG